MFYFKLLYVYFTRWSSCSFTDCFTHLWNPLKEFQCISCRKAQLLRREVPTEDAVPHCFWLRKSITNWKISKKPKFCIFFFLLSSLATALNLIPRFFFFFASFLLLDILCGSVWDRIFSPSFSRVHPCCTLPCLKHVHHKKNHSYNKGIK